MLYLSFGSKVRPRTFACIVMGSTVLFILKSRLLLNSAGSGVNRVQVVLSEFCVKIFFVLSRQKLYVGMVVCFSWLHSSVSNHHHICIGHELNQCLNRGNGNSAVYMLNRVGQKTPP